VPSERQIAANRRNAQNSTGPRSGAGKKRASGNSYRHGLSATAPSSAQRAKHIDRLARKIAGHAADVVSLEYARAVAQAEFDLVQVRQIKVALIERMRTSGEFEPAKAKVTMPETKPGRSAEGVRRALPELLKLDRYERRAAAPRWRSLSAMVGLARTMAKRTHFLQVTSIAYRTASLVPLSRSEILEGVDRGALRSK
jgi:hypothetical protein